VTKRRGKIGLDKWFIIVSAVLGVIMILIAAYSIFFLSNNLFKALVPRSTSDDEAQFDLEGYREVVEDLGRTPIGSPE
jgi:hypothetical protein